MNYKNNISYLDYNATTPVDPKVLKAMLPFLKENFANPSSTHYFGKTINEAVKAARSQVSGLIGADQKEIIFTSGATEAINIAIKGVAQQYSHKGKHIITSTTEHEAVLETCRYLETLGYDVTYLSVNSDGLINLEELKSSIRVDTILVSIMYVNNETGVIQPIKEISKFVHETGVLFMSDTTQAVGKLEIDVNELEIDILCMSGHKMYAPKGIGALYVKKGIKIPTFIHGGGQEDNIRSGSLNVPGIIALGVASKIAKEEMKLNSEKISKLRGQLENEILKLPNTYVNGSRNNRVYNTTNICFKGNDANVMIGRLKNIAISNGSACNSRVVEPSHVLTAMGVNNEDAFASLRFSLGKFNTEKEINHVVERIKEIIELC